LSSFPVTIDSASSAPLNVQLKEQVKWLIVLGELKPGDHLPTVQEMADRLRINRNTVAQAYAELQHEGYLAARSRQGTFVADSEVVRRSVQGAVLVRVIDEALERAGELGFTPEEFSAAAVSRAHIQSALRSHRTALYVECTWYEVESHTRTLHEETGIVIEGVHLDDVRLDPEAFRRRAGKVDVVITTLYHLEELQDVLGPGVEVIGIGAGPEVQFLRSLASLPRGTTVAVCCLDRGKATNVRTSVINAGVQHLNMMAIGIDEKEELRKALEEVQVVYVSQAAYPKACEIIPHPDRLRTYTSSLDRAGIEMLKVRLAVPQDRRTA
jgi:GntR family transcriptional regulator